MLGIIGAKDMEMDALFAQLTDARQEAIGFSRFAAGRLGGVDCVLGRCGVGKAHAAACAQALLLRYRPDAVINIGVAGALLDDLRIGDLVVASSAVQHDIDTTPVGDPRGLVSGLNLVHIPCDAGLTALLAQAAREAGLHAVVSAVATGDQFVCGAENKRALAAAFDAAACDMEGGAIAQICYEMGVPYAAYRAVSDTVADSGRDYLRNIQDAADASARLMPVLLRMWGEQNG